MHTYRHRHRQTDAHAHAFTSTQTKKHRHPHTASTRVLRATCSGRRSSACAAPAIATDKPDDQPGVGPERGGFAAREGTGGRGRRDAEATKTEEEEREARTRAPRRGWGTWSCARSRRIRRTWSLDSSPPPQRVCDGLPCPRPSPRQRRLLSRAALASDGAASLAVVRDG